MVTATYLPSRLDRLVIEDELRDEVRGYPDILRRFLLRREDMPVEEALRVFAQAGNHRLQDVRRWAQGAA